jgi:diadenosine tetraphosphate (Ap4A) HIT family hydrolase
VAVEGFSVPHVHVHLVPVNAGDELDPKRARPLDSQVLDPLQQALIAELQ